MKNEYYIIKKSIFIVLKILKEIKLLVLKLKFLVKILIDY